MLSSVARDRQHISPSAQSAFSSQATDVNAQLSVDAWHVLDESDSQHRFAGTSHAASAHGTIPGIQVRPPCGGAQGASVLLAPASVIAASPPGPPSPGPSPSLVGGAPSPWEAVPSPEPFEQARKRAAAARSRIAAETNQRRSICLTNVMRRRHPRYLHPSPSPGLMTATRPTQSVAKGTVRISCGAGTRKGSMNGAWAGGVSARSTWAFGPRSTCSQRGTQRARCMARGAGAPLA